MRNPGPLLFLADGSVLVRGAAGVQWFAESGTNLGTFTTALVNDMTLGPDGNVYATDPSDAILVYDGLTGASLSKFSDTPLNPSALAFRPVPEPSSALLVGSGLAILVAARRASRTAGAASAGAAGQQHRRGRQCEI